jgi:hypothetical protein
MSRVFWTRSIPTAIWYVPPLPGSTSAEAGVLTTWSPLIFEKKTPALVEVVDERQSTLPTPNDLRHLKLRHKKSRGFLRDLPRKFPQ